METGSTGKISTEEPMYLERFLDNVKYPISKNNLIVQAKKKMPGMSATIEEGNAVLSEMLRHLGMLPDREYSSRDDVVSELHK